VADVPTIPQLAYDAAGPQRAGVPVVLLHSFPLDRSVWRPVADRLAAASVRVISPDLPGLGASPLPAGPPDLAVSADAVAALLDRIGAPRAVLAGVSMGGYVALAMARRHPHRLAALALVDTKAQADDDAARANRERVAVAVLGEAGTRALVPMLDSQLAPASFERRPEVVEQVRRGLAAARPEGVAWSQRAMAARPDSTRLLASITVPVAVVAGADDALIPPAVGRQLAAGLPDAVLTLLPDAGHLSPLEVPDAVANALLALLLRVPQPAEVRSGPAGVPAPPG